MFRLWAEIWNPTQTTMYGTVNLAGLTVERNLDRIGLIRLELPVQDPNAQFLAIGRVAVCYTTHPYGRKRHVMTALLEKSTLKVTSTGDNVQWQAADLLEELRRLTTYMGRNYAGYSFNDAVNDMMALATGWDTVLMGTDGDTALRFDGTQILNALQTLGETHGYHFRLGATGRTLEMGVFGASSGIRATNIRQANHTIDATGDVYLLDRLDLVTDGGEITNWIIPLMGNNEAFLHVGYWANEVGGIGGVVPEMLYNVNVIDDGNNNLIYTMSDAASVAAYGQRQRVIFADKLYPVGSVTDASGLLYVWAQNWLLRHKDPQTVYRLSLSKWADRLKVGDKLQVIYRGEVYQSGEKVRYADIDAALWILKMTERYSIQGATLDLEVSAVDLFPSDPAEIIANAIENQKRRVAAPELRFKETVYSSSPSVNRSTPGTLAFNLSDNALLVARAYFTITRANTTTAPDTLEITVNGTLVTGGPYLNGPGSGLAVGLDLRTYMTTSSVTAYTISVSCLYGSGTLDLTLDLFEITGSIVS